ncbi:MAG: hypothetical protein ACR2LN_05275 [Candidatus Levyibacteriota bacterium]
MIEQQENWPSLYDSEDLREEMGRVDSLAKFIALVHDELPHVPVQAFLYDFGAQLDLLALMEAYSHHTRSDKEPSVVILKKPGETDSGTKTIGGTTAIEPYRFRLDDKEHIYFFNQIPQGESLTLRFMDPETQIFPKPQSHVTVYPLNRVPRNEGHAQRYNYRTGVWEASGQGIFRGEGIGNLRMNKLHLPRVYGERPTD